VDKASAFTGETFRFDATKSDDPDGNITRYHFDFGDGTFQDVDGTQEPKVDHRYVDGGEYIATVVVMDNGAEKAGKEADTAETPVSVNERMPIAAAVITASPLNRSGPDRTNQTFEVTEGVDRFELGVGVDLSVYRIDEAVEPDAGVFVAAVGHDHDLVLGGQPVDPQPSRLGVESAVGPLDGGTVQSGRLDGPGGEVEERGGAGFGAGETDGRLAPERLLAVQVEPDVVVGGRDDPGPFACLFPSEVVVGHRKAEAS
jgi:PKD repeat protein